MEGAAVKVPDDDALAELRGIRVGIEKTDPAIGGLLMAVVGDRADGNGEGRKRARLPMVMAGLNEMKKMIVCPVTRLDDRTAFGVPRDAIGIARAFGDDLEFARARMHGPDRAVEQVFLAVVGVHAALIEDAIQAVEPAVGSPRE